MSTYVANFRASHAEQGKKRDFRNRLRMVLILWFFVTIVPDILEFRTHYEEYQAFLAPEVVTKFIITTYQGNDEKPFRRLVDEDPAHMTELCSRLSHTKWGGLASSLSLFDKKNSIQYRAVIHYQTGWATLYISPEETYLYLKTPSAYRIRIDNPELHHYIWETYCSQLEE